MTITIHNPFDAGVISSKDVALRYKELWMVESTGKAFVIRSETRGDAGKAIQAAGIALGSVIRPLSERQK